MERLWRSSSPSDATYLHSDYQDVFTVTISKPGPRGDKRPPLIEARVRAEGYSEAVEYVEQEFLRRTQAKVVCG